MIRIPIRLSLAVLAVGMAGCWIRPEIPAGAIPAADRFDLDDDIQLTFFQKLERMDIDRFTAAWSALDDRDFELKRSLAVLDEDGETVGQASQEMRILGDRGSRTVAIIRSDSTGSFERSVWSRFSNSDGSNTEAFGPDSGSQLAELILPDDPLFLSPQGPSYFVYRAVKDTTIVDRRVEIIETMVRPETARHGIQWARFYIREDTLVGLDAVFVQESLLYQEITSSRIMLKPSATDWLPDKVDIRSTVGLPFSRSRTYVMHVEYDPKNGSQPPPSAQ